MELIFGALVSLGVQVSVLDELELLVNRIVAGFVGGMSSTADRLKCKHKGSSSENGGKFSQRRSLGQSTSYFSNMGPHPFFALSQICLK